MYLFEELIAVEYWNTMAQAVRSFTGTTTQVGGSGYVETTTDHNTLKCSSCKSAYLVYQSLCGANPYPLLRAFVCLCLEQLDETSDAPLPNVTSSPSFWENKLALS